VTGASVGDEDPVLTFCCRPNNPTGLLAPLPAARPLVVDEAYYEYCGETAAGLLDDGVIVIRTFSKALTRRSQDRLRSRRRHGGELNARQAPAPVSTLPPRWRSRCRAAR
jgi:hypothetical protein